MATAPYNCVFVDDDLTAVFDFDFAHPGPRTWDLAYALYRFVPLADSEQTEGFGLSAEQARRMRLLSDAYGLMDRSGLYEAVIARIHSMVEFLLEGQQVGDVRRIASIEAGHLAVYRHDLVYVERHRDVFEAALA